MKTLTYQNPVYDKYFADPFVWRARDRFYAIGTGPEEAAGRPGAPPGPLVFPLLESPDLAHWTEIGRALVRPDAALGDTYWAPEVAERDGLFYLYYSVGFSDRRHHLRVAASANPAGPYIDQGEGLTDPSECPFAIDPHPFRGKNGEWYLFNARDFLDTTADARGATRAGTALVVHELAGMTRLSPNGRTILRARHDWQRYENPRSMYGRVFDWHTLEGPSVLLRGGRYYCFYSGGRWQRDTYGVDYGVADHVLGPYSDAGNEGGPRVLRTVPGHVLGPGHNSFVLGPDDETWFIVYHAWDAAQTARRLCIDPIEFTVDGPCCRGPSYTPQALRTLA